VLRGTLARGSFKKGVRAMVAEEVTVDEIVGIIKKYNLWWQVSPRTDPAGRDDAAVRASAMNGLLVNVCRDVAALQRSRMAGELVESDIEEHLGIPMVKEGSG